MAKKCKCQLPVTCCPRCCSNFHAKKGYAEVCDICHKITDKYGNPLAKHFKPIFGNYKKVVLIKPTLWDKILYYLWR